MKSRRVDLSKNVGKKTLACQTYVTHKPFSIMTHCVKSKQATVACQNMEMLL